MKSGIFYFLLLFTFYTKQVKSQHVDTVRYVLDSTYAETPFFGNILIVKDNQILLEKSYGYADALNKVPLTKANSFQVASISKQFTAYGIMFLKNKELLDYDSLVSRYISNFPYNTITIRHLLNHTSGLPDFWKSIRPFLDTTKSNGNNEVLNYLIQHPLPLQFEPGTRFSYSDIGYDFLAIIIEKVSGKSYQQFMHTEIFKPLKMKDTYAYMVTDIRKIKNKNLAIGHSKVKGNYEYAHLQQKNNHVFYLGNFYGDGSVVTTARDLAIWEMALKECKLLPCDVQNEAFIAAVYNGEQLKVINSSIGYGFGWFIKSGPTGKIVYHSGGHPGNIHYIYRLIDKGIVFIFLSNADAPNLTVVRNRILSLLNN